MTHLTPELRKKLSTISARASRQCFMNLVDELEELERTTKQNQDGNVLIAMDLTIKHLCYAYAGYIVQYMEEPELTGQIFNRLIEYIEKLKTEREFKHD